MHHLELRVQHAQLALRLVVAAVALNSLAHVDAATAGSRKQPVHLVHVLADEYVDSCHRRRRRRRLDCANS